MAIVNIQGITAATEGLAASVQKSDSGKAVSFSNVMNQASYQKTYSSDSGKVSADNVKSNKPDASQNKPKETDNNVKADSKREDVSPKKLDTEQKQKEVKEDAAVNNEAETIETVDSEALDSIDDITEVIDQIGQVIMEVLNIDAEELQSLLNQLKLTPEDLLVPDNVLKVVMTETGSNSMMDILNNEELSQMVKNLMEQINSIKSQAQISDEMVVAAAHIDVTGDEADSGQDVLEDVPENLEDSEETYVEGVKVVLQSDTAPMQQEAGGQQPKGQTDLRQAAMPEMHNTSGEQAVFQNLVQAVSNTQTANVSGVAQAVDIVTQIVEQIKTVVKSTTTSMELQLNPASLGKVHIQIVSREGMITAQITAQTETARNAIEAQLSTLKETFQNQGLKVEAVEVAVDPNGFQDLAQREFEQQRRQNSSKSKKQLNLEDMDDEEELTEEEAINVDMMQRAGNQVDFIA